jgi:uncharacterized protein (DUF305 family)
MRSSRIVTSCILSISAAGLLLMGQPSRSWAASNTDPVVEEGPFLAENDKAMTRMMEGMAAKPTGDVDRDFVAAMTPHHQGAIDMAQAELRYGHNEQLHRIAQEIIVEQQQEIAAMALAIGQRLPPSAPAADQQKSLR